MGSILRGICKCGFDTDTFFAGGGLHDSETNCFAPAVCRNCKEFLVKNYLKKYSHHCPESLRDGVEALEVDFNLTSMKRKGQF